MISDNPWREIEPPSSVALVNARRVDADLPWDFFWARGTDRRVLLTLRHAQESAPDSPLPDLRDIEVTLSPADNDGKQILAFKLLDMAQQEIFRTLCLDIVSVASRATSEAEAISISLMRTWRWHHLLRGGSDTRLTPQEQMGLLGELFVLERLLLPSLEPADAVSAWRGPFDAPKDFQIGRIAVEAKAHRSGATPSIAISSEDQLDAEDIDMLFLFVTELNSAPVDAADSVNLQDVANRLTDRIYSLNPSSATAFESLLLASGLRLEDDYSATNWLEGGSRLYLVNDVFPRITRAELRTGVSRVRYNITLTDCEPFIVPASSLIDLLLGMGDQHGD